MASCIASASPKYLHWQISVSWCGGAWILLLHAIRSLLSGKKYAHKYARPAEILANPDKYQGKTIPVNSGYITPADIEKELSKATNNTIRYRRAPHSLGIVCLLMLRLHVTE